MTKNLPCQLTAEEKAQKAYKLVQLLVSLDEVEEERKTITSEYRSRLKGLRLESTRLREVYRSGIESRPVPVEEQPDSRRGEVYVIRLDTGEVVSTRPMTADERQGAIQFYKRTSEESMMLEVIRAEEDDSEPGRSDRGPRGSNGDGEEARE